MCSPPLSQVSFHHHLSPPLPSSTSPAPFPFWLPPGCYLYLWIFSFLFFSFFFFFFCLIPSSFHPPPPLWQLSVCSLSTSLFLFCFNVSVNGHSMVMAPQLSKPIFDEKLGLFRSPWILSKPRDCQSMWQLKHSFCEAKQWAPVRATSQVWKLMSFL